MTKTAFLKRLEARKQKNELKSNILFGLVLGWVFCFVGLFRAYILVDGRGWLVMACLGFVLLTLSLLLPDSLACVRKPVAKVGERMAGLLLRATLLIVYFCAIVPVARFGHDMRMSKPFGEWASEPEDFEGWIRKVTTDEADLAVVGQSSAKLVFRPFHVMAYFLRYGKAMLWPSVALLLIVALVGIFVESTSLAPLIYTLF